MGCPAGTPSIYDIDNLTLFFHDSRSPGDVADIESDVVCSGLGTREVGAVERIEVVETAAEAGSPVVIGAEFPFVAFVHVLSDGVGEVIDLGHFFRCGPAVEATYDAPAVDLDKLKIGSIHIIKVNSDIFVFLYAITWSQHFV